MRLSTPLVVLAVFLAAAGVSLAAAGFLATSVEERTEIDLRRTLDAAGMDWAEVQSNGLRVTLSGLAPDEAARFKAINQAGEVVDAARIVDAMDTAPGQELEPPRFSAEILRNDSGISMIGLIPSMTDRAGLMDQLAVIAGEAGVSDLMESANYPVPPGWDRALDYTLSALGQLPRSKISLEAGRVAVTAIADSATERDTLEMALRAAAPQGLEITLDISAPRQVIAPFTLRYRIEAGAGRFDACSAEDQDTATAILAAARHTAEEVGATCQIGLGAPSPDWAEAARHAIAALTELGDGSVTFADADLKLVAAAGTPPSLFDRVVGELEAALPPVFALQATLTPQDDSDGDGPPEFTATLSPEGLVQLRGRLNDAERQAMVAAYAKARFGSSAVYSAARTATDLPADWPLRVLAGIEALSRLSNGAIFVTPDLVTVKGASMREDISAEISGLLAQRLGESGDFELDIVYREPPPPAEAPYTTQMCETDIAEVQRKYGKIGFEPGSGTIAEDSAGVIDAIATILNRCGPVQLEIEGHTDSQGRTSMNQELSQKRAQSVLDDLLSREVPVGEFLAIGYGESRPIAENDTPEGREANRRIEFRLILPEPIPETETTLEALSQDNTGDSGEQSEDEQN